MATTVHDVIDRILEEIPDTPLDETVDTIKCGDPDRAVTGIVTTFLASVPVIRKAATLGANFIITHEPTFYGHRDEVDWLEDDPVYQAKRRLLEDHAMVVWRCHDHWHRHEPDGIGVGVVSQLGWTEYAEDDAPLFTLPATTVGELAEDLKAKLGAERVRVVGDLTMPCHRAGLMVGAAGGHWQIGLLSRHAPDVLVVGEINEWETCEYVRDAVALGHDMALLVVGHANSEEAGMAYLATWLRERLPDIPITHVPVGDPFEFV